MIEVPDIVRLRASSLAELFDDSARWAARALGGVQSKTYGKSHLGTSIHHGTADFDNGRILDGNGDVDRALVKFREMFDNDAGVHWVDIRKQDAYSIGVQLVADYCTQISHQFNWVAVESTCEPMLMEMPNGITFELTGTTDRVYELRGRYGICDFKSGGGIIGQDGEVAVDAHGPQLAEYELLESMASRATALPITLPAIILGLSTKTGEIAWREVPNARTLLFGEPGVMGYLEAASIIIKNGVFVGNPKSILCSERYCGIYDSCFYRIGRTQNVQR